MKKDTSESGKKEVFWLTNPSVLIDYDYIMNIWPKRDDDVNTKLNAVTRCVVLLTLIGLILTQQNKMRLIATALVTMFAIVFYQHYISKLKSTLDDNKEKTTTIPSSSSKEGFQSSMNGDIRVNNAVKYKEMCGRDGLTDPKIDNPMMNVMPMDIKNNPQRPPAQPSYKGCVKRNISQNIRKNLDPRLFCDLGDELAFSHFERRLHTMPNSQIPNNQKKFAEFCYGNTAIVKDTHMNAPKCNDILFST